jgi:hypothetical protein
MRIIEENLLKDWSNDQITRRTEPESADVVSGVRVVSSRAGKLWRICVKPADRLQAG